MALPNLTDSKSLISLHSHVSWTAVIHLQRPRLQAALLFALVHGIPQIPLGKGSGEAGVEEDISENVTRPSVQSSQHLVNSPLRQAFQLYSINNKLQWWIIHYVVRLVAFYFKNTVLETKICNNCCSNKYSRYILTRTYCRSVSMSSTITLHILCESLNIFGNSAPPSSHSCPHAAHSNIYTYIP